MYNGITLDGTTYDVRIVYGSIKRAFSVIDGQNAGQSITNRKIRDVVGTEYTYTMQVEPNPANLTAYNSFYEAITSPQATHTVVMPYGNSTMSFTCCIYTGEDTDAGIFGGTRKWQSLTLTFSPVQPQRS